MLNTNKITFRCLYGRKNLFTPEYLHDVVGMRQHPEYEEVVQNADGEWAPVPKVDTDLVQRPLMSVDNAATLAPTTAPKARAKKK